MCRLLYCQTGSLQFWIIDGNFLHWTVAVLLDPIHLFAGGCSATNIPKKHVLTRRLCSDSMLSMRLHASTTVTHVSSRATSLSRGPSARGEEAAGSVLKVKVSATWKGEKKTSSKNLACVLATFISLLHICCGLRAKTCEQPGGYKLQACVSSQQAARMYIP